VKKFFVLLLALVGVSFGQLQENYNGYGDTVRVNGFYNDTTIYTKWFKLSAAENIRLEAYARDTSAAGFLVDSTRFEWGIQTGRPSWLTLAVGSRYVVIAPSARLVVDTFTTGKVDTPTCFRVSDMSLDASYDFVSPHKTVDTLNVSGWAFQSRNVAPEWDVYVRFWLHGLAGNKKSMKLENVFQLVQRLSGKSTGF
jgi:hypothetical protein